MSFIELIVTGEFKQNPVIVRHRLCALASEVAKELDMYPADCSCPEIITERCEGMAERFDGPMDESEFIDNYYRFNPDVLLFIERAVHEAIGRNQRVEETE